MRGDVHKLALMHSCVIILNQTKSKVQGSIHDCRGYYTPRTPRALRQLNVTRMQEDRVLTEKSVSVNNADGGK